MDQNDDLGSDEPSRAKLIRRVRQLERDIQTLEGVLEDTFNAWLVDRKRLAAYEDAELIASITYSMEHPESTCTLRDILDELERESGQSDQDGQPPS